MAAKISRSRASKDYYRMVQAPARLTYGDYEGCSANVRKAIGVVEKDPRC
jgi:hypothetical protein